MLKIKPAILYSYRRCPYAMRARMALRYANIEYEIREISFRDKPQSLRRISPKATVPVLLLPDGQVIDQSLDIMNWALQQSDPDGWLLSEAEGKHQIMRLIEVNDRPFKILLDQYKYPDRHPDLVRAEVLAKAITTHIKPLDEILQKSTHLLGEHLGLADVAIFPFIRQFSMVDPTWFESSPYEHLRHWLKRFLASELFNAVMAKNAVWID